ncbi:hypothetical protein D3C71_1173360 [compost metagenome]
MYSLTIRTALYLPEKGVKEMHYLRLYIRFIMVYLRTRMEYKFAFFMDMFIQIFTYSVMYFGIWIMLDHFQTIKGWTYYEIMFVYNLNLFSYGLSGLFFWSPMRQLEGMIQSGEFDGLLTKPIPSFLHLIFRQFNHAFLGHIVLGSVVFIYCMTKLDVMWTAWNVLLLIVIVIGAMLIQSSIIIMTGCVSFWFVKSNSFVDIMIYGFRFFLNYPLSIYHKIIQIFLTVIIPYGFINFYPSLLFLRKEGQSLFPDFFKYGTPVVGVILFSIALFTWSIAVNKYQSTGS